MKRGTIAWATVAWMAWSDGASAEERLKEVSWTRLQAEGRLVSGETVKADGRSFLRLRSSDGKAATLALVVLDAPGVTRATYALRGEVRYTGVTGQAYLEMWSHLAEGAFFSRTLGEIGPMKAISGSSEWRSFILPFFNKEGGAPPTKLVVNLVLPGAGTVDVSDLTLVQFAPGESPLASAGAWGSDRTVGLLGGIAGSVLGVFGAVIGVLGSRGRGRTFVLAALKTMMALGVVALAGGAIAFVRGEAQSIGFTLLLLGVIALLLPASTLGQVRKRYEAMELRRMRALDASR